jgi:arginine utilization regulatory protein
LGVKEKQAVELYAIILDQLDIGVHVVDTSGRTLIYNRKMAELEDISPEEINGKVILDVLDLTPEASTLLTSLKNRTSLENKRQTYLTSKGTQVTTVNSTLPLFADGQMIGAMELAKDMTYIKQLAEKVSDLQQELNQKYPTSTVCQPTTRYSFADILGQCEPFLRAVYNARQAARTDSTILIHGETGTGKELFAQSIHRASPRASKPFIAQNCAALPEELLEGLLFGTSKGGFTGAVDRPGLFELAQAGTLFLDEINSMPLRLQAKLLRVLQERTMRRVGGLREITVDVRILSSCSLDPEQAVRQQLLREDLFYRLSVVTIGIPPLRERKEDIPFLIKTFTERLSGRFAIPKPEILPDTLYLLVKYSWPGNVRELEHMIEGSLNFMPPDEPLSPHHLPIYLQRRLQLSHCSGNGLRAVTEDLEKEKITLALQECLGNISQAAQKLGISRQSLQHKLKKYKLM